MLLTELRRWLLPGLHLLDVGGGIGVIAVELARVGLASFTLADASAGYLEAAQFFLGDFAAILSAGRRYSSRWTGPCVVIPMWKRSSGLLLRLCAR